MATMNEFVAHAAKELGQEHSVVVAALKMRKTSEREGNTGLKAIINANLTLATVPKVFTLTRSHLKNAVNLYLSSKKTTVGARSDEDKANKLETLIKDYSKVKDSNLKNQAITLMCQCAFGKGADTKAWKRDGTSDKVRKALDNGDNAALGEIFGISLPMDTPQKASNKRVLKPS